MNGGKKIIGLWRSQGAQEDDGIDVHFHTGGYADNPETAPETIMSETESSMPAADAADMEQEPAADAQDDAESLMSPSVAAPDFEPEITPEEPFFSAASDYTSDEYTATHDENWIDAPTDPLWKRLAGPVLTVIAIGWVVFFAWTLFGLGRPSPDIAAWPAIIAQATIPLALIAVLYLAIQRSSYAEANRYGLMAQRMVQQSQQIEEKIAGLNAYLATSREELTRQADEVTGFGLKTAQTLQTSAQQIREALTDGLAAGNQLADNSTRAMQNMDGLLAGLPKVDDVALRLTENLREAGRNAHQHGSALEAQIAAINENSERATTALARQQEELKAQLAALTEQVTLARGELESTARTATERFTESGQAAEAAYLSARSASDEHTTAYLAQLDAAHTRLDDRGQSLLSALTGKLAEADAAVVALTERVAMQDAQAQHITTQLITALNELDGEFASFDEKGRHRIEALAAAVDGLTVHTETMAGKVQLGAEGTSQLISRSEDLMVALDTISRELEESLPAAFGRLDERLAASQTSLGLVGPELVKVENVADATLARLREADALVGNQHRLLLESGEAGRKAAAEQKSVLEELQQLIAAINHETDQLSNEAGPRLVEALVRVRQTATQASDRVRSALAAVIPESAEKLGAASYEALHAAIGSKVDERLAAIAAASDQAAASADAATARLMQQFTSLTEASAEAEKRVGDAKAALEEADHDNLTRRVAVLTESLNSTAIDVSKILSNDVTDTAWEAYLKGDRGVFTRRAVRLLDNNEAREILRYYDSDVEFRSHVNRYIHDFEAILRNLMGARDGSALSVTLLSSDMGKLYVALAQAIERLRN